MWGSGGATPGPPPTATGVEGYASPRKFGSILKCKSKICDLKSGHKGRCMRLTVVNTASNPVVNKESRQVVWQQANRERYNEKMREYMSRKRAEKRAGVSGGRCS